MATIHLHATMSSTPQEFIASLTDFGPGRQKLFENTSDDHLVVHSKGPHEADVTEGSASAWERLRYDWSDPTRVVMTTIDSNLWGGNSGHTYTFTQNPDGTTKLDAVVVRQGKNFKGRMLGLVLAIFGKQVLGKALKDTVKVVDARNADATEGESRLPAMG